MIDGERPVSAERSSRDAHLGIDHLERDLKGRSVRGSAAMVLSEGGRFAMRILGVAVLARLLTPADFGLIAMVATFTRLIELFRDLGLATATIQRTDISQEQVSYLFWVNVAAGVGGTALAAALAPVAAWFYGEPGHQSGGLLHRLPVGVAVHAGWARALASMFALLLELRSKER
jgi:PST family polysaccharide transporter